ncbi:MAG: UDP-N-acetylglucosamine/UDP-N-acetylgalactosamine diphosphorylase [Planctomycetota bacterium]|jgi:UDP-N-acetylglucosamine/UDP-N-acetylgalactosamine diphosphorylase
MTDLHQRFLDADQGHVFRFWDQLSPESQQKLAGQAQQIDLDLVALHKSLLAPDETSEAPQFDAPELFPAKPEDELALHAERARTRGAELLRGGKVGFVLVAGGQGSRLGFDGPKGMFPVGPVSGTSLFAWHAARLKAAASRHGSHTPWYVMTSATNDAATRAYFGEQDHFGMPPEQVHFFSQAMVPALDLQGRILLAATDEIFLAPNGHGGTLHALAQSGLLRQAIDQGIETLSYFQVDNPLARPACPLFLGLHSLAGAGMSSKVVAKTDPGEKVGVLGTANGKLGCIEYSDLPAESRDARDSNGDLVFRAGNIAVHALQTDFVDSLTRDGLDLPWHLARKDMTVVGESGELETRPGVKFETFIFDALAKSPASVTLEVERHLEFSPVKNAEGSDSPASCRKHMTELFSQWLRAAQLPAPELDDKGVALLEIDPCFAEDEREFINRLPADALKHERGQLYR